MISKTHLGGVSSKIQKLVDVDFPNVERIKLVGEGLSAHRPAALHDETFPPEEGQENIT
ncbi:MAG: hypothetical protein LBT47_12310 [Deltaproteobacteria bacterium]|nr:hypothetical protein [Deltaproteobacteria bacterium]